MTTITTLRFRSVLLRVLHVGGTLASCQRSAIEYNKRKLQSLKLNKTQQKVAVDAEQKLQALDL